MGQVSFMVWTLLEALKFHCLILIRLCWSIRCTRLSRMSTGIFLWAKRPNWALWSVLWGLLLPWRTEHIQTTRVCVWRRPLLWNGNLFICLYKIQGHIFLFILLKYVLLFAQLNMHIWTTLNIFIWWQDKLFYVYYKNILFCFLFTT